MAPGSLCCERLTATVTAIRPDCRLSLALPRPGAGRCRCAVTPHPQPRRFSPLRTLGDRRTRAARPSSSRRAPCRRESSLSRSYVLATLRALRLDCDLPRQRPAAIRDTQDDCKPQGRGSHDYTPGHHYPTAALNSARLSSHEKGKGKCPIGCS